jgi:hypothetical protein
VTTTANSQASPEGEKLQVLGPLVPGYLGWADGQWPSPVSSTCWGNSLSPERAAGSGRGVGQVKLHLDKPPGDPLLLVQGPHGLGTFAADFLSF